LVHRIYEPQQGAIEEAMKTRLVASVQHGMAELRYTPAQEATFEQAEAAERPVGVEAT
jgi:hypothetical protein